MRLDGLQAKVLPPGTLKNAKRILKYTVLPWGSGALLLGIALMFISAPALAQCGGPMNSCTEAQYDSDLIRNAVGNLFWLIEGAFGALIMVVAGIGAILAASMGAYRAAVGMLVVAVGSFILRSLVSLFFGSDFIPYESDF